MKPLAWIILGLLVALYALGVFMSMAWGGSWSKALTWPLQRFMPRRGELGVASEPPAVLAPVGIPYPSRTNLGINPAAGIPSDLTLAQ